MDSAAGPRLTDCADVARRRWRLVVAGIAVGVLAATAALLLLPRTYVATTAVQVEPSGVETLTGERSGRTNGEINLDTQAQVVTSAAVAGPAATAAGDGLDATEARDRVSVTVPPNSSVLEISFAAASPRAARDGAAAFADAYLDYRTDRLATQIDEHVAGIQAELDARYEELTDATRTAARAEGADRVTADARAEAAREEISGLHAERAPLTAVRESVSAGVVLTPAEEPVDASQPVPPLWLAGGALLGLALGAGIAYLTERGARRPRHAATTPESPAPRARETAATATTSPVASPAASRAGDTELVRRG